ncbi:hypothetical protein [Bordetella pseudohinzii]|uniref:Uncharacterized protein n=1 Tax=Bordetella pseudohinzii TaxID=1331258 RepID=A0A0J6C1Q3_9BORD|nr:hypothetical protein [Bordetella pseudohinzii]ANY17134.1 hypothetical protein BBN53_15350 [Bordetella pseudohinzii]KMM24983.1 hypothetical protein L540_03910 [Bordetella pseudohinzii]KXA77103.1 hypothetical protein AW877_15270 [Bordetella pseudohinzii]KXA80269.1 hypothetical protein AW878_08320 [Bordetella pseudohinzii]CUI99240.1 Uncharacterised protein [Bordetella pseudohinzii]
MEWKITRSGWVGDRNFDVEMAEDAAGFVPRVKVYGFPPLDVPDAPYPTEALALKAAVRRLSQEFDEEPRLN